MEMSNVLSVVEIFRQMKEAVENKDYERFSYLFSYLYGADEQMCMRKYTEKRKHIEEWNRRK